MVRKAVASTGNSSTNNILDSIKEAAATVAYGLAKFYTGNNTGDNPGNLPDGHFCTSSHSDLLIHGINH